MKQVIGFAETFYTLWSVEVKTNYTQNAYGQHFPSSQTTCYYYQKNVSKDIDKVKELYPNLPIDEGLRGKVRSWQKNDPIELPEGYFWWGKHKGKLIEEVLVIDYQYCLWVLNEKPYSKEAKYIESSPIYINYQSNKVKQNEDFINQANPLKVGEEVEIEFLTKGFSTIKEIYDNDYNVIEERKQYLAKAKRGDLTMYVRLNDFKEVFGKYPYIMPSINGKCCKTKGKTFKVNIVDVEKPYIVTNYGNKEVYQYVSIK